LGSQGFAGSCRSASRSPTRDRVVAVMRRPHDGERQERLQRRTAAASDGRTPSRAPRSRRRLRTRTHLRRRLHPWAEAFPSVEPAAESQGAGSHAPCESPPPLARPPPPESPPARVARLRGCCATPSGRCARWCRSSLTSAVAFSSHETTEARSRSPAGCRRTRNEVPRGQKGDKR
jgi:hypothetical protein